MWTPQNRGHFVCKNAVSNQNLQFYVQITAKFVNFSNCANVQIDLKVGKRGSLGVD